MPDRQFSDARLAALYDRQYPPQERDDLAFYLPLVMAARAVLDVGCGTGALLRMARDAGHTGRLVGLDPAPGMLEQARARTDIEWVLGDIASVRFEREFDLVVMTGHAFQVLVTDAEIRDALVAIRDALTDGGRFAFETRNPLVRTWEEWTPENGYEFTDASGARVRWESILDAPVMSGVVRFTTTYTSPGWDAPEYSHSTLRFLDAQTLGRFLTDAGLAIEQQYGDWDHTPFGAGSPEIITIARRHERPISVEIAADAPVLRRRPERASERLRGLGRETRGGEDPVRTVRRLRGELER